MTDAEEIKEKIDIQNSNSILVAGDGWHQGVIGIVASRLARDYNRPVIVLTIDDNEAHGSGRGIGSINMVKILSKCSQLLTRYGGHPMAVGLGMDSSNIAEFCVEFEKYVRQDISVKAWQAEVKREM